MFTCRVTAGAPFAYEPPAMETFALRAVKDTRWKSGWIDGSVELASGKLLPTATEYSVPFTEMTAVPGVGALALLTDEGLLVPWLPPPLERPLDPPDDGRDDEEEGGDEEDDDEEDDGELAESSLSCCANGSLLAKRLNEESCPSSTLGGADEASAEPVEDDVDAGVSPPPREGAARLGVPAVVVVVFSL